MESKPKPMRWLRKAISKMKGLALPRRTAAARRPRVGLALGGGFARGIAHIGVLKGLVENGVPIDCIAGTSVGALIASAYACGAPLSEMEKHAAETQFKDFGRWTLSWLGLASNERLESYLHRFCVARNFEELKTPLAIAATDLSTGDAVYFTRGEIAPALRASCAYPGLFLPVEHEGRILVDGFLAAPVPVDALRRLGAEFVIAVFLDSSPPDQKPANMLDIIGRSFAIMQRHANKTWQRKTDVVIAPDVAHFAWDDFRKTPELIAAGEAAAITALPRIRAALRPPTAPLEPMAQSSSAAD
jgi:NTE family protein